MIDEEGPYSSAGAFRPDPTPVSRRTTDLEYREAAVRLAIAHFVAKGDHKVVSQQVVDVAKHFERYLRTGER